MGLPLCDGRASGIALALDPDRTRIPKGTTMSMIRTLLPLLLITAAAACSKSEDSAPAGGGSAAKSTTTTTTTTVTTATADPKAKATELFTQRCTPCHGAEGRGDGAASAGLDPKPRNFHDQTWQQKVTDDHLMLTIKSGGAAVGLSAAMPSNPDLNDQAVLAALKDHIRELGKAP
jgi:mono/diheme cytochrome c family protein